MKRYDLVNKHLSEGGGGTMEATYDGEWVRYDDAQAEVALLTKERDHGTVIEAQLRVKIDRLTAERDEAHERFVFWRNEADKRTAAQIKLKDHKALCINCGVLMTPNLNPHPREPDYTCPVCGGQIEKRKENKT